MVLVLKRTDRPGIVADLAGKPYTPEDLVAHMSDERKLREAYPTREGIRYDFLFEERLRPHEEIVEVTGSETLCTLRILTLLTESGTVELVAGLFKLQPENKGVDNTSAGAMAVSIDLQTGVLGEGSFMYLKDYRQSPRYREYPGSPRPFYGRQLPLWGEVVSLAKTAAAAFPMTRCIGWDVAISDLGPVLVEGNAGWGVESLQLASNRGLAQGILEDTYRSLRDKASP